MAFIKEFFDFLINIIQTVIGFFTGIFNELLLLGKYVGLAFQLAFEFVSTLPSFLVVWGTITISVSVLYLILGRNAGGSK